MNATVPPTTIRSGRYHVLARPPRRLGSGARSLR